MLNLITLTSLLAMGVTAVVIGMMIMDYFNDNGGE